MKNYIKTNIGMLLLLAASTSFSQGKQQAEVPANYRNSTVTDTTNIADIKWKSFFVESDLTALIDKALAKNNDLQIAQKNMEIANLRFSQSKWGNVPRINGYATASSTRLSDNSLNGFNASQALGQHHIDDYSAGFNLAWEADIWGKIRNQKKAARATYLQTAEVKKAVQTGIVATISDGFYDLLMLDAQLEIAKKTLELNDSTLFAVNLQYEAGQVTLLAKEQTESQRLIAAQLIPELEKNIQLQENAIAVLSGSFPEATERASKLETIEIKEDLAAGIPSQLLAKRPDVKAAELAVKAADAKVGVTRASLYPSLNITAVGGANSYELNNWFNLPASLFGSVAGGLTAPLFNGKRLRTEYNIAKVEQEQAVLRFKQSVVTAFGEVSSALAKIDKLEKQHTLAAERVATLQKAVNNANLLFRSGMATYVEVNIAQGNLLQAELQLAAVKKERLSSNVELYRALGGGWE